MSEDLFFMTKQGFLRWTYKNIGWVLLMLVISHTSFSQNEENILNYDEYLDNIYRYHPIAQKANLRLSWAKAQKMRAKGGLDPMIDSDYGQKEFNDQLYYRQFNAKLKIPTQFGVDFIGGYENTDGIYLNPENKTDQYGLWNVGIEVNVLQGLLINERRTAIKQAEVFQDLAANERRIILNDLIYNASVSYMLWQQYHYFNSILEENLALTDKYLDNTKASYFNGEKTSLDTIEAYVLNQDAKVLLEKNRSDLIKSKQIVENFMWYNELPVAIAELTIPEDYRNGMMKKNNGYDFNSINDHSQLRLSLNKLTYTEIEQRLKREKLKPKLKLKYNPLLATADDNISPSFSNNDFKWGVNFSMPLIFRTARADVQIGKIKLQELNLEIQNKRNELKNKIEASWNQQAILKRQEELLSLNVDNYKLLLDGENEKFNYGESSVFLLNNRQEKYINGQLKLIEIHVKKNIELLNYLYYSDQLISE